jgi:REP element-mobilizing transposase RayT
MADHMHLLCSLDKQTSVAELVREIKSNWSKWIHLTFSQRGDFAWQSGYGAFAVSFSNLGAVRRYIANQAEHHRTGSFQDELRALLKRHQIELDERYIWD